jgi:O-antigen/teichoic acid export membrane protein
LNFILIPLYQSLGAAFATVVAEGTVALTQAYMLRHVIDFKQYFGSLYKYLIGSILMFGAAYGVGLVTSIGVTSTILQVSVGIIVYFGVLIIMKEPMNRRAIELMTSIILRRMKGKYQH